MNREEKLTQELLIVIDKNNASALYSISSSVKGFNTYLMSEKTLTIQRGKIKHKGHEFEYSAKLGKVKKKDQKFFYLVLTAPYSDLEKFRKMLRELKRVIK
ncbi:hypothetical protein Q4575_15970 [Psychrosphaera sp. 1_MG-2023]|uniref:hypothetical protein n=1 Tax=Psychrosphaera sp. 1_MG-2023 TaxID=3062643 RepID=UPI0026E3E516|nr:hypothetical protein [Psychrosphaera sp. 1_MG-2023]MDO6720911.1 hypothetical protein [Psychrosphaera sp. 1_MG-2023]